MGTKAFFGQGALLKIGNGATPTEAFNTIPNCGSFTGPGQTRDTVDTTNHSSPAGYREFIGGLRDGGDLTFDINWIWTDTYQNALEDAFEADDPVNFQLHYPYTDDGEFDIFQAYVTNLSKAVPIDAQVTRSVTLKITGPVTRDQAD